MAEIDIENELMALIEELAFVEHERWSHWQRYMHARGQRQVDGALLLPPDLVARWERQMSVDYDCLPESEKQSDRDQVQRYLKVISARLQARLAAVRTA